MVGEGQELWDGLRAWPHHLVLGRVSAAIVHGRNFPTGYGANSVQ